MSDTKHCGWCGRDKPVTEFYTRKKGLQAGQATQWCQGCNTDAIRHRDYTAREKKGELDALVTDLQRRLAIAERVKLEMRDKARMQKALEIGLRILAEQEGK